MKKFFKRLLGKDYPINLESELYKWSSKSGYHLSSVIPESYRSGDSMYVENISNQLLVVYYIDSCKVYIFDITFGSLPWTVFNKFMSEDLVDLPIYTDIVKTYKDWVRFKKQLNNIIKTRLIEKTSHELIRTIDATYHWLTNSRNISNVTFDYLIRQFTFDYIDSKGVDLFGTINVLSGKPYPKISIILSNQKVSEVVYRSVLDGDKEGLGKEAINFMIQLRDEKISSESFKDRVK